MVPINTYGVLAALYIYSRGLSEALTTSLYHNTIPQMSRRWIGVTWTLNTGFEHCTLGDLNGPRLVSARCNELLVFPAPFTCQMDSCDLFLWFFVSGLIYVFFIYLFFPLRFSLLTDFLSSLISNLAGTRGVMGMNGWRAYWWASTPRLYVRPFSPHSLKHLQDLYVSILFGDYYGLLYILRDSFGDYSFGHSGNR